MITPDEQTEIRSLARTLLIDPDRARAAYADPGQVGSVGWIRREKLIRLLGLCANLDLPHTGECTRPTAPVLVPQPSMVAPYLRGEIVRDAVAINEYSVGDPNRIAVVRHLQAMVEVLELVYKVDPEVMPGFATPRKVTQEAVRRAAAMVGRRAHALGIDPNRIDVPNMEASV